MMMAMCRLNVPSIYIYGGSILPGTFKGKPVTIQDVYEAVGKHSVGAHVRCRSRNAGTERLSVGRRLRRAIHRQHHGDDLGGDRSCFAVLRRRAGALRDSRQILRAGRRDDHGSDRQEYPPARHRHAQGAGERRRGCRRDRRLDQCCAASAGHRQRMRHQVRSVRRRRSPEKDTLYRGFETGRPLCRQRHVRSWRRSAADEDAARPWLPPWRLPHRHRPHHRREPEIGEVERRSGRRLSGQQADSADRRRRRARRAISRPTAPS